MFVRRVIEKEVNHCSECPYYYEGQDMGATWMFCDLVEEQYQKEHGCYGGHCVALEHSLSPNKDISKKCPLQEGKK